MFYINSKISLFYNTWEFFTDIKTSSAVGVVILKNNNENDILFDIQNFIWISDDGRQDNIFYSWKATNYNALWSVNTHSGAVGPSDPFGKFWFIVFILCEVFVRRYGISSILYILLAL